MKKDWVYYAVILCLLNKITIAQSKKFKLEPGISVSAPPHDDMWRTHSIASGAFVRAHYEYSQKISATLCIDFNYFWARNKPERRHTYPDAAREDFSILSFKAGAVYSKRKGWFWGAETGFGKAHTKHNGTIGIGWVEEYNGIAKYGVSSSVYTGKYIFVNKRQLFSLSFSFNNFFTTPHGENSVSLRVSRIIN